MIIKVGRIILIVLVLSACRPTLSIGEPAPSPSPTAKPSPSGSVEEESSPSVEQMTMTLDERYEERVSMVEKTIEARGVEDPDVLAAMRSVPRHGFVPEGYVDQAYEDHPLPIGYGQTISQPYVVAWMTELLALQPGEKVLEIGTGSGYQAAVLAELPEIEVYSVEIVPELAERAAATLDSLGYDDVKTTQGDGYFGWPEYAPFDAIIVTAAPDHLPQPLVQQLTGEGRLVIPIGPPGGYQGLWRFTVENGELVAENLGGVMFVPFTGTGIGQQ